MAIGQLGGPGPGSQIPAGNVPVQQPDTPKLTPFDYVTRLGLPLLLVVVAVARLPADSWWFWAVLGLALVSFAIGIYHPGKAKIKHWIARRRDTRRAQNAFPHLKRFVIRFGRFVDAKNEDVLGQIVQKELREENVTSREELGAAKERLFQGFWDQLRHRLERQSPDAELVLASVSEFNYLVTQYLHYTVLPVYEGLPRTVEGEVPNDAKRELEVFREDLKQFLHDYKEFAESLSSSLETQHLEEPYVPPLKPLP